MAMPLHDDPRRPLYAAVRYMTLLGAIHLAVGMLLVYGGLRAWPVAVTGVAVIVGGIGFLVCASIARRHRAWAVWCGIGLGTLFGFGIAMLLALLVHATGWIDMVRLKSPAAGVAAVILLALLA